MLWKNCLLIIKNEKIEKLKKKKECSQTKKQIHQL